MTDDIQRLISSRSFLESPRWHDGRVWVSDYYTHQVISSAEDGSDLRVDAEVPAQPSGLGWLPDGRLVVAAMDDQRLLRQESDKSWSVHADLADHIAGPLNDLMVDAAGRTYVGYFGFDLDSGEPFSPGGLICVTPDGAITHAAEKLLFPNGMALTDEGVLLVNETFGNRISAFAVQPDGSLTDRRVWAQFAEPPATRDVGVEFPKLAVAPDGGCLDEEGCMWVADAAHGRVVRVHQGGEILDEVSPSAGVFACMLGGTDRKTLFMCTAPDFDAGARSATREAALLSTRVAVAGAGRP